MFFLHSWPLPPLIFFPLPPPPPLRLPHPTLPFPLGRGEEEEEEGEGMREGRGQHEGRWGEGLRGKEGEGGRFLSETDGRGRRRERGEEERGVGYTSPPSRRSPPCSHYVFSLKSLPSLFSPSRALFHSLFLIHPPHRITNPPMPSSLSLLSISRANPHVCRNPQNGPTKTY